MTTSRLETIHILPSDMMDILLSFDINKATGPHLISPYLLKRGQQSWLPLLLICLITRYSYVNCQRFGNLQMWYQY